MLKKLLFLVFFFVPIVNMVGEAVGTWPLPAEEPWSNVILAPYDQIKNLSTSVMEPLGFILLGGKEGDPVVAIESGIISYSNYKYCPTWRTSFSYDDLGEFTKEIRAIPGADPAAIHIVICITNLNGSMIYYSGLSPIDSLPKTGLKVTEGQVIGHLGHAFPNFVPNLCIEGSNRVGQNRILTLLGSPYPPLQIQKTKSRSVIISKDLLQKDVDVFCNALMNYYPGLYDITPKNNLEVSFSELRKTIPPEGLTISEFANRLRIFIRLFSDNHISIWESYTPEDVVFLPIEIGAINGKLYIVSSQIKSLPVGAQISSLDGTTIEHMIDIARIQVGRSDGTLGNWERESLSKNAGRFWVNASGHHAGDKIVIELSDGSKSTVTLSKQPVSGITDWWTRTINVTKSRGTKISGFEDTPNIVFRQISPNTDSITLHSFDWSDVEKDVVDRYFSDNEHQLPANIILDLRSNPGGEQRTEWNFIGYFTKREIHPFVYKTVVQKKLSAVSGITNLVDGDEKTFGKYVLSENGLYQAYPEQDEVITAHKNTFNGRLIILTNGMTGSAAFDVTRLLQTYAQAILVGRPGPHGTNRMIAEKFALVYLPSSSVNLSIPMVKIVTEKYGETDPAKPLSIDYPVEISLDSVTGDKDPEWDLALDIVESIK